MKMLVLVNDVCYVYFSQVRLVRRGRVSFSPFVIVRCCCSVGPFGIPALLVWHCAQYSYDFCCSVYFLSVTWVRRSLCTLKFIGSVLVGLVLYTLIYILISFV